jgi:anti-sigma regulatory factor (Ser/Thr protein kinase)
VEVQQQLPSDAAAARLGRATLEPLRGVMQPDRFDDLRLIVSELVANCARHGGRSDRGIVLQVRLDHERVHVRVRCACGATQPRIVDADNASGGLGLRIVDRLAQAWGVQNDDSHTTVWVDAPA